MAQKRKPGGLTASRQTARARCVYCGRKTDVTEGLTSTPLARYPHSVSKQEVPPLCEASRQGKIAQRSSAWSG